MRLIFYIRNTERPSLTIISDQKYSDPHQQVKTALASIIMQLATLIGDEHTNTHLVPLFLGNCFNYDVTKLNLAFK